MNTRLTLALAMALAATLAACGGGGSSDDSSGTAASGNLSGLWQGTAQSVLITESGELWAIQQSGTGYGLAQGSVTRTRNSVSGTVLSYPVGFAVSSAVAGSVSGNTLTGTLSNGYLSATFSGTTSAYHLSAPLLTRVAGTYALHSGGQLTVSASGTVAGTDEGCSFTGTVTPDSGGRNYYRVTVSFGASPCLFPNATGSGVVVPVSDNLAYVGLVSGQAGLAYALTR